MLMQPPHPPNQRCNHGVSACLSPVGGQLLSRSVLHQALEPEPNLQKLKVSRGNSQIAVIDVCEACTARASSTCFCGISLSSRSSKTHQAGRTEPQAQHISKTWGLTLPHNLPWALRWNFRAFCNRTSCPSSVIWPKKLQQVHWPMAAASALHEAISSEFEFFFRRFQDTHGYNFAVLSFLACLEAPSLAVQSDTF